LQKAQRENCESRGDSSENYYADDLGDDLWTRKMPVRGRWIGCCDNDWGEFADAGRESHRAEVFRSTPRLREWKQQADGYEHSPINEKHSRLTDSEKMRKKSGGQNEQSDLGTPIREIRKPVRRVHRRLRTSLLHRIRSIPFCIDHFISSIMRAIAFRSFSRMWRSFTRWTSSGSAEPLKTRSINSRIIPPMT